MSNYFKHLICGTAVLLGAITLSNGQSSSSTAAPKSAATGTLQTIPAADSQAKPATSPAPMSAKTSDNSAITLVQGAGATTNAGPSPAGMTKGSTTAESTEP